MCPYDSKSAKNGKTIFSRVFYFLKVNGVAVYETFRYASSIFGTLDSAGDRGALRTGCSTGNKVGNGNEVANSYIVENRQRAVKSYK